MHCTDAIFILPYYLGLYRIRKMYNFLSHKETLAAFLHAENAPNNCVLVPKFAESKSKLNKVNLYSAF